MLVLSKMSAGMSACGVDSLSSMIRHGEVAYALPICSNSQ
jgi:hypothetical protein